MQKLLRPRCQTSRHVGLICRRMGKAATWSGVRPSSGQISLALVCVPSTMESRQKPFHKQDKREETASCAVFAQDAYGRWQMYM